MTTCLQCAHIQLKAKPKHSKSGWAPCPKQSCGGLSMMVMIQRERVCPHFNDAPAEIVAGRDKWILKLQQGEKA